jgi:hypothetical protein
LTYQSFDVERMWWRLFYIRAYVVKVIPHTSVCGEGYSTYERMWWRLFYIRAYVLKVILHTSVCGEGYSTYERMWWRLFYIRAYVVKVILHTSVCGEGYSTYASCPLNLNLQLTWFIRYIYYSNLQFLNMKTNLVLLQQT